MSERKINFMDCLMACASNREFVASYDRLRGTHLSAISTRSVIDWLIDEATGRDDDTCRQFIRDVHDLVWMRLPWEVKWQG